MTRADIIEAAVDIVRARGPEALTMRTIAAAMNVTATALYRHFEDRSELLDAVVASCFAEFRAAMTHALPDAEGHTKLHIVFDRFLHFGIQRPNVYRLLFAEAHGHRDTYPADFRSARSPTFRILRDSVAAAIRAGELRGPEEEAAEISLTLYAHMHGLLMLYVAGRFESPRTFERFYLRSLDRLLEGLRRG